ncbi:hypothetical protein [Jiangella muralis]|uniref:hypothetical protein n=1 Tax=Jiangella muralis TaxID=702383 RepID=UPI0012F853B2|nr:hypothetical protein [Jiangella muralis]
MRKRLTTLAGVVVLIGGLFAGAGAPAQAAAGATEQTAQTVAAANLWNCRFPSTAFPFYIDHVCTTVTSAPASGVRVLDRSNGSTVTFYNGTSVYLQNWYLDSSGLCGVNGDPYVWAVGWMDSGGNRHSAYIGDWYLSTGSASYWASYRHPQGGTLNDRYAGSWSGACNRPL